MVCHGFRKRGKSSTTVIFFAGYDLVQDKEAIAKRQYASHKIIYDACVAGDCEAICKAIKGHYWRTIGEMMREQNVDAPDLERGWDCAF